MAEELMNRPFESTQRTANRDQSSSLVKQQQQQQQGKTSRDFDEGEMRRKVAKLVVFGFDGTSVNSHARKLISLGAGGVILFARNIEDPYQVAQLCADLKKEAGSRALLTMVDQEGGRVQRLGPPFTPIPAARKIGSTREPAAAGAIGSVIGRELRSVNIDMDLAPVLDVDSDPPNPVMSNRCFGSSSELVSEMGYTFIRSLQREGVAACAKHYPGLGHSSVDSHLNLPSLPFSLDRLNSVEFPPFQKAVEGDVAAIMVGHINVPSLTTEQNVDTAWPATLSKSAIDYLRNELLFEGLVVCDSLEMGAIVETLPVDEAAVQAVLAGVDMVMVCHRRGNQMAVIDALASAVLDGRLPYDRVKEAERNIDKLGETYCRRSLPISGAYGDSFQESRMSLIGCKEHSDLVANILHHPSAFADWES